MKTASNVRLSFCLTLLLLPWDALAADPFAESIRTTPWLSPQDELNSFRLPPGFEIQLVAAEPDLLKPMNLAFDDQGRLWVTVTREYPYPVLPPDKAGRDAIIILVDNNNDGQADQISRYAEGLNLPIGIYPYENGAIAWSIPNLWRFRDTDGDGRADDRERLYGPLGFERDTHGMNSSFLRGFDGWLYITHGYNNNTTVSGLDGHTITMNSGNTYRVRLDGSRVEQHTWGQVNPFGMCFDPLGNMFTADCHSAPVYQLLRGGYYPSFGKPHDGLGFAPTTVTHSHGSTAISGIACYADTLFPSEFRGNLFIGNVMTCRINRDSLTEEGSTLVGRELPDFVRSEDPWFRPVSVVLGPDGALYIADFYNRIIGHYEVPLNHPGRDRTSGRIWRVVYRGPNGEHNARPRRDLTRLSVAGLIEALADDNLTYRMLAMNRLADHHGQGAVGPLQAALQESSATPFQYAHGLWILYRLDALPSPLLRQAAQHPDRLVRTHVMRILAEQGQWSDAEKELVLRGLSDADAFVQRSAAEALGLHPAFGNIAPLLALRHRVPAKDTHTTYAVRKAIRDQLLEPAHFEQLRRTTLSAKDAAVVADVALAVPSPVAASFLFGHLKENQNSQESARESLRHVARFLPVEELDSLAQFTSTHFDLDFQFALFQSIQSGLEQRGLEFTPGLKAWGLALIERTFGWGTDDSTSWVNASIDAARPSRNPWSVQNRSSADGRASAPFLCSLPSGEQLTGTLRSEPFTVPGRLTFFIAGHDGYPDKPPQKLNAVRLRAVDTGALLAETFPPRNDLAQAVTWDLQRYAGQRAYIEITDADTGDAYAWLAVGRFEPPVVRVPDLDPKILRDRQLAAAGLVRRFEARGFEDTLAKLLLDSGVDPDVRAAMGDGLLFFSPDRALPLIQPILQDAASARVLCEGLGRALGSHSSPEAHQLLLSVLPTAPYRLQVRYAEGLAANRKAAEELLNSAQQGAIPAQLFLERSVRDKLLASLPPQAKDRLAALTRDLDPVDETLQRLIDERRKAYQPGELALGKQLFAQQCGACHQIGGEGGLIGPQLEGIGNRGLERLCEDILDPNRNVDKAFRNTLLILKDGDVVSGLFRRQEGEQLVLAESTGAEIFVASADVAERRESETSLMPENFSELLTPDQFNQLMAFLLAQRR